MSSSDANANNSNNSNNNSSNSSNSPPGASPNGLLNLAIYGVCSIIYIIFNVSIPDNMAIKFLYVGAMLGINIGLTLFIMNQYCASPNIGVAIGGSVLTWGLFVVVFGLLENYYVWLRPFSNTFGYLLIKVLGVVTFMDKILKKDDDGSDKVNKYLKYIRSDPWGFFSMLTAKTGESVPEGLQAEKTFEELSKGDKLQPGANDAENKAEFVKFVRIKESVAKLVFYLLTLNLMTDMASVFVMENSPCVVNQQIIKQSNNQLAATTVTGPPKKTTVYKTTE